MSTFKTLGVKKDFIKGLSELGIQTPTDIQMQAIPFLLEQGTDFIGQAQTGTGKTAAFGLPLLQRVNPKNEKVQALILSPTRELGQQIAKQLFKFTKYSDKIFVEAVYGGEKIDRQISRLSRPTQIIVATPGRLIDLVKQKAVDLSHVKTVVLDEADEMLSMGFKKELDTILEMTDGQRNTWLFSATMPSSIMKIVEKYMSPTAKKIEVDKSKTVNTDIEHKYVVCDIEDKTDILIQFLKSYKGKSGIVFTKTKAGADKLSKQLLSKNIPVDAIHGDLTQKDRDKVMRAFKGGKVNTLVATDISARGIDVKGLAFVVHYQLPEHVEYYTHRSGRTGRAGSQGVSLAFVVRNEKQRLRDLERELNIKIKQIHAEK